MRHRNIAALAAAGLCLFAAQTASAQQSVVKTGLGIALEAALDFGGDTIGTIVYEDDTDQNIHAGEGITLGAGLHYLTDNAWDFRGTFGYKFTTSRASNADPSLKRFVAEAVVDYFITERWFVGAGVTHHSGIELDLDGLGPNVDFDDATGLTVEAGWWFLALTYTDLTYKASGVEVDASNFGVSCLVRF